MSDISPVNANNDMSAWCRALRSNEEHLFWMANDEIRKNEDGWSCLLCMKAIQ